MLEAKHTTAESELEEFIEEHTGEDGLLADATQRQRQHHRGQCESTPQGDSHPMNPTARTSEKYSRHCAILIDIASKASRAVKKEQEALGGQVLAHYATLTEDEIKEIVVEDKWVASIQSRIENEVQRLTQALTERVQELEERYAQRLPDLAREVDEFSGTVAGHLKNMGVDWV